MKQIKKTFVNGILSENPTFRLVLGTCPTLAVTTEAFNGIGMGLAVIFVLVFSNLVISLIRNFTPEKIRIPVFIVVIAAFVTIVQLVIKAYFPDLDKSLGIFIPLIVVNCIILGRAEAFASKNGPLASVVDGLGMGIGFTLAITMIAMVRELLGNGTLFGLAVFGDLYVPMLIFILAPGGFLTYGLMMALFNWATSRGGRREGGSA
ncbi:MAG: electron transport complex subunit E [Clostridiales bacterium]|jgi:electron transport complex protein RnfE|nr:electron transport complex subunit E [Clostridiales bacterium]